MIILQLFIFVMFALINGLGRFLLPALGIRYDEFSMVTLLVVSAVITIGAAYWAKRFDVRSR